MTTATGANQRLAIVPEVSYGVVPATPAFQTLRHTGTTLGLSKAGKESADLRGDRQVGHFRHGARNVAGDINVEFSYGTFDDLLEAALGGTWAANVLKAGATRRSFLAERYFADLAVPEYWRYHGLEINTVTMKLAANAEVSGSFGCIAQDQTTDTAIVAGATYAPVTTSEPFDAFTGAVTEGGVAFGIATSLDLSLNNGLRPLFAIGSDVTDRPGIGLSRITGTLGAFFQSKALLDKFINETGSSLSFVLQDPISLSQYLVELPNVKYTGGQPDVSGDGEVITSLPFVALYDAVAGSNIVITRTP